MTIKNFAALCGCSPQTLRYYDRVDLLKPIRVDKWSKYRFYSEDQAVLFAKIKSLQTAGFSIDEIKRLSNEDDGVIYKAIGQKISELESRLESVKAIQGTYMHRIKQMNEKIARFKQHMLNTMSAYDPSEEFGIDTEQYADITQNFMGIFNNISDINPNDFEWSDDRIDIVGSEAVKAHDAECADILHNDNYKIVYEKHGWQNARDFIPELRTFFDAHSDFSLCFLLDEVKNRNALAFGNTFLGSLLTKTDSPLAGLNVNLIINDSKDGLNHFYMLRPKQQND